MKSYWLRFGDINNSPSSYTGLSPTLTIFSVQGLTAVAAPGITEQPVASGLYRFQYSSTLPVVFQADGATTGLAVGRYVNGVVDPVDSCDEALGIGGTLTGLGASFSAFGSTFNYVNSAIGTTASSYGSTSVDPGTVFGYLKRIQEWLEGNSVFTKATGSWQVYNRTASGTTTLLGSKTLSSSTTTVTKS